MRKSTIQLRIVACLLAAPAVAAMIGCEGSMRRHDPAVADISPPTEMELASEREPAETYDFPNLVESMMASRQGHIDTLKELESAYLKTGDSVRANWASRQRAVFIKTVEVYPYLTERPGEYRVTVAPEASIPEANTIFDRAVALYDQVKLVPGAGILPANQKKARAALYDFKSILRNHPTSDKVDDCAFYCGDIYKEYLREDDPDNELAVRYYRWAIALDPQTPHPARFNCAVVLDYRRHQRDKALELYHEVLEDSNDSNARWAATRIEQLTDEQFSHERPRDRQPLRPNEPLGRSAVTPTSERPAMTSASNTDEPEPRDPGTLP